MLDVKEIPLDMLEDNPYDRRKKYGDIESLAESIKERGLQNPISVVKINKRSDNKQSEDHFIIVHGHRRTHAFRYLKRKTIPGIIRRESTPTDLTIDLALENLQRKDLLPTEKGETIEQLFYTIPNIQNDPNRVQTLINQIKTFDKTHNVGDFTEEDVLNAKKLLKIVGISTSQATIYLRLSGLPEEIKDNVVSGENATVPDGKLVAKSAYELSRIKDPELQKELFKKAVENKMKHVELKTVVDKLIDNDKTVAKNPIRGRRKTDDDLGVAKLTEDLFSLSSKVEQFRNKIPFLCERLQKVEWTASLDKMKKACLDTVKNINDLIQEDIREEELIEFCNADLEINIVSEMRYKFPSRIADVLKLKEGDILQLKIEGIKRSCPAEPIVISKEENLQEKEKNCLPEICV